MKIIKRFDFSSNHQSNSVIIRNELDDTYRFYIKGAPEKIKDFCNKDTIPSNYNEILKEHTQRGFRVLACATKPLEKNEMIRNLKNESNEDDHNFVKECRIKFEKDLHFLGFIILSNKLKPDTSNVISNLKASSCKIIMATGDNPFTSISVGKQCKLIEQEEICLIDIEDKKLN